MLLFMRVACCDFAKAQLIGWPERQGVDVIIILCTYTFLKVCYHVFFFFRFEMGAELPTGTCCTTLCRWYTKRPLKFSSLLKSCSSSCLASFPKITFISLPCLLLMWSLLRTLHELKIFCIGPTFCILPNIPISMLYSFKLLVIRTYVISSVTQRTNLNQYIH